MQSTLRRFIRTCFVLSIFIAGLPITVGAQASNSVQYTAVIDAGSSGSRIFLYETRKTPTFIEIRGVTLPNSRVTPGLSSYQQPTGSFAVSSAGDSLAPLLRTLRDHLAANNISREQVPVYVLATAGMRQIDRQQPEVSRAIYQNVQDTITRLGHPLGSKGVSTIPGSPMLGPIGTLSGQNEALFGWLDVNYLMGNFDKNGQTVGIVEMGGASAQVAYAVPENFMNPNVVKQTVNGQTYYIFALSYLDLGLDQILRTAVATRPDNHPCFVSGTPRLTGTKPEVRGRFDFITCQNLFSTLIEPFFAEKAPLPAGSNFENAQFAGIGAIPAKLARWNEKPNTLRKNPLIDVSILPEIIDVACKPDSWEAFLQWFNGPLEFANDLCAHSTYLQTFLFGSNVKVEKQMTSLNLSPSQLRSMDTINQATTSWTRGLIVALGE